jgi:riboflavin transporter FmnP
MNKNKKILKLAILGLLSAISILLVAIIHIPIFPWASFLEYDPADIPILLGTILYGPISGFVMTVVVSLIQGFTVSAQSGIMGIIMHIFATGSLVLISGFFYKKKPTTKGLLAGLGLGSLAMIVIMILLNLVLTPIFLGAPVQAVIDLLIPAIIPFNVIKAVLNAGIAFILYDRIKRIVKI